MQLVCKLTVNTSLKSKGILTFRFNKKSEKFIKVKNQAIDKVFQVTQTTVFKCKHYKQGKFTIIFKPEKDKNESIVCIDGVDPNKILEFLKLVRSSCSKSSADSSSSARDSNSSSNLKSENSSKPSLPNNLTSGKIPKISKTETSKPKKLPKAYQEKSQQQSQAKKLSKTKENELLAKNFQTSLLIDNETKFPQSIQEFPKMLNKLVIQFNLSHEYIMSSLDGYTFKDLEEEAKKRSNQSTSPYYMRNVLEEFEDLKLRIFLRSSHFSNSINEIS